ncbi:MAG TPA: hypothetical protein VH062_35750 [Polyangiaceae bacterium]|nr:hypothetical protein [Polyangiaceae bacterium]
MPLADAALFVLLRVLPGEGGEELVIGQHRALPPVDFAPFGIRAFLAAFEGTTSKRASSPSTAETSFRRCTHACRLPPASAMPSSMSTSLAETASTGRLNAQVTFAKELLGESERIDRAVLAIMSALEQHAIAKDLAEHLTTIASASASVRFTGHYFANATGGETVSP